METGAPSSPPREHRAVRAEGARARPRGAKSPPATRSARVGAPALATSLRALEESLRALEAQAAEDFHLLDTLAHQVAVTSDRALLATLARDERALAEEALARAVRSAREGGNGAVEDETLGDVYARARRGMAMKVVALTEAHAACRADRMRLLTSLVAASQLSTSAGEIGR